MTKEEIAKIINDIADDYAKTESELHRLKFRLHELISQAIAEHEASKWKKYPENKPNINKTYWVHTKNGSEYHMNSNEFEKYYVIAFREPHRYTSYKQEGGRDE